jgi:fatty-acyl-CoA synthase
LVVDHICECWPVGHTGSPHCYDLHKQDTGATTNANRAAPPRDTDEGEQDGWLRYEDLLAESSSQFERPPIAEGDLISINYTSGTTSRPKGVMLTHRNVYLNVVGTLMHLHLTAADRYFWTLPMFHANGWTFPWVVTAVGGAHVCLHRLEPARVFDLINRERITMLCAAPTVLIGIANSPEDLRRGVRAGVRVLTAGRRRQRRRSSGWKAS